MTNEQVRLTIEQISKLMKQAINCLKDDCDIKTAIALLKSARQLQTYLEAN